ncbi:MAG: hypothetical protein M3Y07_03025 [Acidobacteriota bacterium]|nr:hypothetical protein [Acidobacteriota bacterium]
MNAPLNAGFAKDLPVVVTDLSTVQNTVDGLIVDISGKTMELQAARDLPRGTLVRIEARDTLWLGEVSECEKREGGYNVRVTLAHALYGLAELGRLAERFAGNPRHVEPPVEPQAVADTASVLAN